MPIYEFQCRACNKKSSFLIRSAAHSLSPACPACGSSDLVRTIASFAYHKSLQTIHEESGPPTRFPGPDYYKDPRNIGRWAEQKFQDMGVEMPSEVSEMIQAAREGVLPNSVKDLQTPIPDATYH